MCEQHRVFICRLKLKAVKMNSARLKEGRGLVEGGHFWMASNCVWVDVLLAWRIPPWLLDRYVMWFHHILEWIDKEESM